MRCELCAEAAAKVTADWLIVPVCEPVALNGSLGSLNEALGGLITRLVEAGDLTGKLGSLVPVRGVAGIGAKRLLTVGLGPAAEAAPQKLDRALTAAGRSITDKANLSAAIVVPEGVDVRQFITGAASAFEVAGLGQDIYRTERARFPLSELKVLAPNTSENSAALETGKILGESINVARDLVNRPPQEITPMGFARTVCSLANQHGVEYTTCERAWLQEQRMHALLAVAQGSSEPAALLKLDYRGAGPNAPVLCFVGKGVTFDSGGLSLKSTENMLTMKCDMAGAATASAAILAIARLRLPVNVTALCGLVENMPGGSAFKLGDILTARNGTTIEVLNTDAEGRLVLADVLSYAVDLGVDRIVDLATLTGACVVALGEDVVGAFTNQQDWCNDVLRSAATVGEDVWQLPMLPHYDDLIKGDVGDLKNTGGRWGGAITAAKFLEKFVAGKPWVHLDIAGPAFASSNKPHREAGATGCCVKTLVELARSFAK